MVESSIEVKIALENVESLGAQMGRPVKLSQRNSALLEADVSTFHDSKLRLPIRGFSLDGRFIGEPHLEYSQILTFVDSLAPLFQTASRIKFAEA